MIAVFKVPEDAIGHRGYLSKKVVSRDIDTVYLYPETLNDLEGKQVTVIPSLTPYYGDYKLIYEEEVWWVFKEFLEPAVELIKEIKIDI